MTERERDIEGPGKLAAWIRKQRAVSEDSRAAGMTAGWVWSMTAFAKQVGVSRQMVRNWLMDVARPVESHRKDIASATGGAVPQDSWNHQD